MFLSPSILEQLRLHVLPHIIPISLLSACRPRRAGRQARTVLTGRTVCPARAVHAARAASRQDSREPNRRFRADRRHARGTQAEGAAAPGLRAEPRAAAAPALHSAVHRALRLHLLASTLPVPRRACHARHLAVPSSNMSAVSAMPVAPVAPAVPGVSPVPAVPGLYSVPLPMASRYSLNHIPSETALRDPGYQSSLLSRESLAYPDAYRWDPAMSQLHRAPDSVKTMNVGVYSANATQPVVLPLRRSGSSTSQELLRKPSLLSQISGERGLSDEVRQDSINLWGVATPVELKLAPRTELQSEVCFDESDGEAPAAELKRGVSGGSVSGGAVCRRG